MGETKMTTIMQSRYTLGKYLGTDSQELRFSVLSNGTPCIPETSDGQSARDYALKLYAKAKGQKTFVLYDGDTNTETPVDHVLIRAWLTERGIA